MLLPVIFFSSYWGWTVRSDMYQLAISLPHSIATAIPMERYGPKANFESFVITLLIIPPIAAAMIPTNAETITACVPRIAPAANIKAVSPTSIPRKSSPYLLRMNGLLTSPIIKKGRLIAKAPITL